MLYSAVCAIARDEDHLLRPWTAHHLLIGFERIVIFDNESAVPIRETLADYVDAGLVEVIDFPGRQFPQLSAYNSYLADLGDLARWTAFIDLDEFIVPKAERDINLFLTEYERFAGLGIHWRVFGSCGRLSRPEAIAPAAYPNVIRKSPHIKSVVQNSLVERALSPHHFRFKEGSCCVNEDRIPVVGPRSYHTSRLVQINHYYYQSQQDFAAKIERGMATPIRNRDGYRMEEFNRQADHPGEPDTAIRPYLPLLERAVRMGAEFTAQAKRDELPGGVQETVDRLSHLLVRGKTQEADRLYRRTALRFPEPLLHLAGSRLYTESGNHGQALEAVRLALDLCPENQEMRTLCFRELARAYEAMGRPEEARFIRKELGE